jgi:hypothetical protein
LHGKSITIRGMGSHPSNTVIDCQSQGRAFYVADGESYDTVIENLQIQHGVMRHGGGGIFCYATSPTIRNCRFIHCSTEGEGGAIRCYGPASPVIQNCYFAFNNAQVSGGAIASRGIGSTPFMLNCLLISNSTDKFGGAIYVGMGSALRLVGSTLHGNHAKMRGGGVCCISGTFQVNDTILWGNTCAQEFVATTMPAYGISGHVTRVSTAAQPETQPVSNLLLAADPNTMLGAKTDSIGYYETVMPMTLTPVGDPTTDGDQVAVFGTNSVAEIDWCAMQDGLEGAFFGTDANLVINGDHVITTDPLFADLDGPDNDANTLDDNDYHIQMGSPCVNAGNPTPDPAYALGTQDIDNQPRVHQGRIDIGVDEVKYYVISGKAPVIPDGFNPPVFFETGGNSVRSMGGTEQHIAVVPAVGALFNRWLVWHDPNQKDDPDAAEIFTDPVLVLSVDGDKFIVTELHKIQCAKGSGTAMVTVLAVLCMTVVLRSTCGRRL